jgi:tetratricopeptide (TPR) repeat protein
MSQLLRPWMKGALVLVTIVCASSNAHAFWGHHRGCHGAYCGWGYPVGGWGCNGFGCGWYGGYAYGPWYAYGVGPAVPFDFRNYGLAGPSYSPSIDAAAEPGIRTSVAKPAAPLLAPVSEALAGHSNVESRRKAERLIREADELFRVQNYHSALQKYKLAVSAAPDLAEARWRQGHALVATHNYALATDAFKRAITLADDQRRDGFQLNDLYGGASMAKAIHLESLAEWALTQDESSDAYFLIGLFLHYDGQRDRAIKFFARASELAGPSAGHIVAFLFPALEPRALVHTRVAPAIPATVDPPTALGTDL